MDFPRYFRFFTSGKNKAIPLNASNAHCIAHETHARPILIITNDFPPKQGGIERFVVQVARHLPSEDIVVLTSTVPGAGEYDQNLPYPVYRVGVKFLLPTPQVLRVAKHLIRRYHCRYVWFGAAAPLGLLAKPLHKAGIESIVATTHGHEVWWVKVPFTRIVLRMIGNHCDVVTYLGNYTRDQLQPALGTKPALAQLTPGVDTAIFHPDPHAHQWLCDQYQLPSHSIIVLSLSRLVERKGQDRLIALWPTIVHQFPQAILIIAGKGSYEPQLRALATRSSAAHAIVFAGCILEEHLPHYYAGSDLFALPCRNHRKNLEVEGLGIVFLEAQACGVPVIVGNSGGAPDAVLPGETGYIVDGNNISDITEKILTLLRTDTTAMSKRAREWTTTHWSWNHTAHTLMSLFAPATALDKDKSTIITHPKRRQ